jgi:hypothetical protein
MRKQDSAVPVYIAVVLVTLAVIFSSPTMANDVRSKLSWMLQTQADAGENAPGSMQALQQLGLP